MQFCHAIGALRLKTRFDAKAKGFLPRSFSWSREAADVREFLQADLADGDPC